MTTTNQVAIEATGLVKKYGNTTALAGVDLSVPTGTVLGVLGPNGAGKTTAVRILGTLLRPDAGHATVGGYDVVRDAQQGARNHRADRAVRLGRRGHVRPPEPGHDRPAARVLAGSSPGPGRSSCSSGSS